jgi:hypothetical protein
LLPIEQLLSEAAGTAKASGPGANAARNSARPSIVASTPGERRTEAVAPTRLNPVSPFAADSARKGGPRQESSEPISASLPRGFGEASSSTPVIMGATALANLESAPEAKLPAALEDSPTPLNTPPAAPIEKLQTAVLQALTDGNQRILVSMLEAGEWTIQGNEVVVKVPESQTVVDMSLGADARRLAVASASGLLGRPVKLKIVPGAAVAATGKHNGSPKSNGASSGVGGRGRAEQDPIVRRLQEKFSAQIRTVIDYKEKR